MDASPEENEPLSPGVTPPLFVTQGAGLSAPNPLGREAVFRIMRGAFNDRIVLQKNPSLLLSPRFESDNS